VAALVVLEGAGDGFVGWGAAGGDGGVGDAGAGEDALGGPVFFDAHALVIVSNCSVISPLNGVGE
jgi:hypothetical protein